MTEKQFPRVGPTPPGPATTSWTRAARSDDPDRVRYLDGHLRAVVDAVDAGVEVRGYYCWSLMDNFAWAEGYGKRFGLVHIDCATQRRTPKTSFGWFRGLIAAQHGRNERDG